MAEAQFTPEIAKQVVKVVARPERPVVLPGGAANPVLESARKNYSAGRSEDALKVISGDVVPYQKEDVERVLLLNSSSERNPDTGEKKTPTNGDEIRRLADSKTVVESARVFIETGTIDAGLRDPLINFLTRNSPAVADVITEIRGAGGDVGAFVDGLISTPGFREELRQLFVDRLNPTRKLTQEATVSRLEIEVATLQARLGVEVTEAHIIAARQEVTDAENALTAKAAEQIVLRDKSVRYQQLNEDMPDIRKELRTFKGEGEPLAREMTALEAEKATTGTDPTRVVEVDARIAEIKKNSRYQRYSNAKAEIDEHRTLTGEIANLQITLSPLQGEITKKQAALSELLTKQKSNISVQDKAKVEAEILGKKGELANAKSLLEAEMMKFYQEVTHMPADAMEKYLNKALTKVKDMWKEEATKQAGKDTTEEGRKAALALEKVTHVWKDEVKGSDGMVSYKPNKASAKEILAEAFKPGGAENVALYLETKSAADLKITPDEHAALKARLKDPEFRKTQSEALAKQALADYLMAGGRLSKEFSKNISNTDFGRALIKDGRALAEKAIQNYKDSLGKGIISKTDELKSGGWKKVLKFAGISVGVGLAGLALAWGIMALLNRPK